MEDEEKWEAYNKIQEINQIRLNSGGRGKYPYDDHFFEVAWENNRELIYKIIKQELKWD